MTPSAHRWSSLSPQQVGRYAEYVVKMQLVLHGFEVYASEVDDRGIDFVLRREPGCYWDVQVKSLRNKGYVFAQKSKFRIRPNLLMALVLFRDEEPDLFLIPAARWLQPDSVFVDRDYEGLKSAPEYGLSLSVKRLDKLDPFRFSTTLEGMTNDSGAR